MFDSNGGITHELELSEIFDSTANGGDSLSGMNVGEGNTLLIPSIDPVKEITNWQTAEGDAVGSSSRTSRTPPPKTSADDFEEVKTDNTAVNNIIRDLLNQKSESLFNLDAEDELTKDIYKNFAENKKENATGE